MNRYAIVVFWSDADDAWVADVPDLRSCSALGSTPEQAVSELSRAVDAWLEAAREAGDAVPEPRFRPHRQAAA